MIWLRFVCVLLFFAAAFLSVFVFLREQEMRKTVANLIYNTPANERKKNCCSKISMSPTESGKT